jgi:hypothetical protein
VEEGSQSDAGSEELHCVEQTHSFQKGELGCVYWSSTLSLVPWCRVSHGQWGVVGRGARPRTMGDAARVFAE